MAKATTKKSIVFNLGEIKQDNKYLIVSLICFISAGILSLLVSPKSVSNNDFISNTDSALFLKTVNLHNTLFDQVMTYFTTYGMEVFCIMATILLTIFGKGRVEERRCS